MKVALKLFHGRESPAEDLEEPGIPGPVFLVDYVHVAYGGHLKLGIAQPAGDGDLHYVEDLLFYDGIYYGDWSVFPEALLRTDDELEARLTTFDPARAARPARRPAPLPNHAKEVLL